jgi:hypothetical protein
MQELIHSTPEFRGRHVTMQIEETHMTTQERGGPFDALAFRADACRRRGNAPRQPHTAQRLGKRLRIARVTAVIAVLLGALAMSAACLDQSGYQPTRQHCWLPTPRRVGRLFVCELDSRAVRQVRQRYCRARRQETAQSKRLSPTARSHRPA